MKINAGEFLTRRAMLSPDKPGLSCGGRRYTFSDLNRRANRLAHAMEKLGVRPGDRVGFVGENGAEHFDLFFGLGKIGGILVTINYRLSPSEVAAIIRDSGIKVLVHGPGFKDLVEEACEDAPSLEKVVTGEGGYDGMLADADEGEPMIEASGDDGLTILYSGWTAGRPRGVLLTHSNLFWTAVTATATLTELGPRFLLALPLFHIGGLGWLSFFMHRGLYCVLMPKFEADGFLRLIRDESVNSFGAVPTMLHFLKESPGFGKCDFTDVKSILAYGQATPVELISEYAGHDIRVRQLYGLTESAGPCLVIDGDHAVSKAGSCGLPFFHTRVKLVDELGRDVPPGEVGEVIIQGGHVMKCYWNQPEATDDVLRGGWLYTGDLARQDGDGFFYIVDRKKELIISGGENISPAEIESVIFDHPGVADVAVIGFPDPVWGELPRAIVVKRKRAPDLAAEEIIEFCQTRIASFKVPREIEFADSLPRTSTGKMEKRRLRD